MMPAKDIQKYQRDQVEMKQLYFEQAEVKSLMETLKRLANETQTQVKENQAEKE